ncbi:hypothetical protein BCR44DRAFT_1438631 [Catenaria anguillulae PL171]|uniref:Secreted protein n=1 Tax=Catenaria anguillulae PL171 TaxID=765915 RepID=A0A1Y2HGY4_9FUNG|nr:hypothetical protein BCR44DRAFT_1438631 [Catenaria anguillulae PL171]
MCLARVEPVTVTSFFLILVIANCDHQDMRSAYLLLYPERMSFSRTCSDKRTGRVRGGQRPRQLEETSDCHQY